MTEEWKDKVRSKIAIYNGPPTGKPKMPSYWATYVKRRAINMQLKDSFLRKAAVNADKKIKAKLLADRTAWLSNYSFERLMEDTINVMIAEVALESLNDGRAAKEAAERVSGRLVYCIARLFMPVTSFRLLLFFPIQVAMWQSLPILVIAT